MSSRGIERYYQQAFTVYRAEAVEDANEFGEIERNWVKVPPDENQPVGEGEPLPVAEETHSGMGLLRQLSGRETFLASQHGHAATHRLYCPYGIDILPGDRVEIDGKQYDVVAPPNNPGQRNHHLEIDLSWPSR